MEIFAWIFGSKSITRKKQANNNLSQSVWLSRHLPRFYNLVSIWVHSTENLQQQHGLYWVLPLQSQTWSGFYLLMTSVLIPPPPPFFSPSHILESESRLTKYGRALSASNFSGEKTFLKREILLRFLKRGNLWTQLTSSRHVLCSGMLGLGFASQCHTTRLQLENQEDIILSHTCLRYFTSLNGWLKVIQYTCKFTVTQIPFSL